MTYWIFLLPIIAGILAQLTKIVIELYRGDFSWHVFKKYGGMPSSHSAFVFALLTEVTYIDGFRSTTFAIALILTVLIIRDATGYRRDMDRHAKIINELVKDLPGKEQIYLPHLDDHIGHTPLQATIGAIIGVLVVIIGNLII
jgi:acid phosphatase family membrane protein YuiD